LRDVAVLLAASVPILFIARALRMPTILGFLVTGVLIGPHALGLLQDPKSVEEIAEIGVVLILFFVGLEFPLSRLRDLGRGALLSGTLQVVLTVVAVTVATYRFTDTLGTAIFYGFLVAFSSTAVILPILIARGEMNAPYGSRTLGVLLLQDLAVIPLVLVIPALAAGASDAPNRIVLQVGIAVVGMAAILLVARFIVPRFMERIGRLGSQEGFTAGVVIIVIVLIAAAQKAGVSAAMGAFAAGIVLAETQYVHKIVATLQPFRDLLSSLFFASIGMLLNPRFVWQHPLLVISIVIGVIALKALIAYPALRATGALPHTSARAALALANVGEFSFVLAQTGARMNLMNEEVEQLFVASAVISIALAPVLIRWGHHFTILLPTETLQVADEAQVPLSNHVIIVGYGLNGRNVATVLSETAIPHIVVEEDPDRVREARGRGLRVLLSDASVPHTLEAASIKTAAAIVIVISSPDASRRIVSLSRLMNPDARIIVRTRYVSEVEALRNEGAHEVIPEEFETSIEIVTRVLRAFRVPGNVLAAQLRLLREETYKMLRDPMSRITEGRKLSALLTAGTSESFLVLPNTEADQKTLRELGFDSNHIAVPVVIRDGGPLVSPPPDLQVFSGDILLLVGAHDDLNRTIARLEQRRA
jgi:CPA2 family monovalent cation:H+ antiporter-2